MITLYQYKPRYGLPNASPFCMKLETYLRMTGADFEAKVMEDPRKNPKGKLPIIIDDGETIADSGFIIKHLKSKGGKDLNSELNELQVAQANTIQAMLEERLYWALVYSRWVDDRFWPVTRKHFFGGMPPVVNIVVPKLIRNMVMKQTLAQGMGRHSEAEIYDIARTDIQTLSILLGDKNYLMGEHPSEIDAVAYAFVANCLVPPIESPLKEAARSHPNLVSYYERMTKAYYPS